MVVETEPTWSESNWRSLACLLYSAKVDLADIYTDTYAVTVRNWSNLATTVIRVWRIYARVHMIICQTYQSPYSDRLPICTRIILILGQYSALCGVIRLLHLFAYNLIERPVMDCSVVPKHLLINCEILSENIHPDETFGELITVKTPHVLSR